MVDQLGAFVSEVQGSLGRHACVETVQGTWADLALNVNVSFCLPSLS